jgi:hypothetical protein
MQWMAPSLPRCCTAREEVAVSDDAGPPTLSLALSSVLNAQVDGGSRAALLHAVHPSDADGPPVPASVPTGGGSLLQPPAPRPPADGPTAI